MTNIERAAQIWCHPKLRDRVMDPDMAFVIAEALDDAFRHGQESMRERAASIATQKACSVDCHVPRIEMAIRSFPIGERK